MQKKRIFISSVQSEFAEERVMLFDYIRTDALLGQIFEPFIFEKTEAKSESASNVYIERRYRHRNACKTMFGTRVTFA